MSSASTAVTFIKIQAGLWIITSAASAASLTLYKEFPMRTAVTISSLVLWLVRQLAQWLAALSVLLSEGCWGAPSGRLGTAPHKSNDTTGSDNTDDRGGGDGNILGVCIDQKKTTKPE